MNKCLLDLNPRYIRSGFRTQAGNIKQRQPLKLRKLACITECIAAHIIKHGAYCFASSSRLVELYNDRCASYGCKPIKERTLFSLLDSTEEAQLITRERQYNKATGQSRRYIQIVTDSLKSLFPGVCNYAAQAAKRYQERKKLQLGRVSVDNAHKPSDSKASESNQDLKNCSLRSKDLSKESHRDNGNKFPSDSFFCKWFGKDANEVKSLQLSAKQGRIQASGAKKLIALHAKHGHELATGFKKFLGYVIASAAKPAAPRLSKVAEFERKVANYMRSLDELEQQGQVEYFRDNNGRMQIRYLKAKG